MTLDDIKPGTRFYELATTRADYRARWGQRFNLTTAEVNKLWPWVGTDHSPFVAKRPPRLKLTDRTTPCIYRGAETGRQKCTSCRGTVQLKVFACAKHGNCTIEKHVRDTACCATCTDYEPYQPAPASPACPRALVTLNIGHVMRPECRESLKHAAQRWGAVYEELTEPLEKVGGKPHWQKSFLARWAKAKGYSRVVYFDSDILIRSDCPNLFDLIPEKDFGIVSNDHMDGPLWNAGPKNRYYKDLKTWADKLGVACPPMHEHANGGVFVFSPEAHDKLFEAWAECGAWINYGRAVKLIDEPSLSVLLSTGMVPVVWMPQQFNTLFYRSELLRSEGRMQTYVYHAAGRNKHRLQKIQWNIGGSFSWHDIQGMFTFGHCYDEQVRRVTEPATFVEVGCWKGKSTAYLAAAIKRSGKPITLYAVDTWLGSWNRPSLLKEVRKHGGDMFPTWRENMRKAGVLDVVTPIREPSLQAVNHFQDGTLDFVFLDGDHSFANVVEEIRQWSPKLKTDGVLAGDDFDQEEVARAVEQELAGRFKVLGKTWIRT